MIIASITAAVAAFIVSTTAFPSQERIFNGSDAQLGQFPFQVWLWTSLNGENKDNIVVCGGSIISSMYILSAAHCFSGMDRNYTKVMMGIVDKREGFAYSDLVAPENIKVHEDYDHSTFQNDLALVRLNEPIPLAEYPHDIGVIRLPNITDGVPVGEDPTIFDNLRVTASGWGRTNNSARSSPNILQYQYMNIMPHESCKAHFAEDGGVITDGQLCTDKTLKPTSGPCKGDSGGPLALNVTTPTGSIDTYLLGVTSYISGKRVVDGNTTVVECLNSNPAVYSNVAYFLAWIFDNSDLGDTDE